MSNISKIVQNRAYNGKRITAAAEFVCHEKYKIMFG